MPYKIYRIAETKVHLSELAEQAAGGEALMITRRGKPIAHSSPVARSHEQIDLQRLRRVTEHMPVQPENVAAAARRMRDDERY